MPEGRTRVTLHELAERFWARVERRGPDECWPWKGYRSPRATRRLEYGIFTYAKSKRVRAHRLAFELSKGPIPAGQCVCHSCDVPWCCNPAHLWLGTVADNNLDRHIKGRTVLRGKSPRLAGEAHPAAKITAQDASAIRADARSVRVIARDFGLSPSTVSRIKRGLAWRQRAVIAQQEDGR